MRDESWVEPASWLFEHIIAPAMPKLSGIKRLIVVGSVGLALLAFTGCSSPMKNKPAPDFELTALDGSKVVLSGLRGKPVLVSVWVST